MLGGVLLRETVMVGGDKTGFGEMAGELIVDGLKEHFMLAVEQLTHTGRCSSH